MPRAGLSTAVVVAEAATVADQVGYDRLTLAAVAQRFGVALPSLYKHVRGLDGLRAELAVLATRELGEALAKAAVGKARGEALRSMAWAHRGYALAHPGRYAATVRATAPDDDRAAERLAAADEALAVVFAVLEGYGLGENDVVDAARAARSALHGFTSLESAGGFGLKRDIDRSFEAMIDGMDVALRSWR
ncbi:MAG: TetR-like C-terminal domain-containing protein [Jiangellaceae bacterium]